MTTFQDQPWSRRAVREGDTGPTPVDDVQDTGATAADAEGDLAPGATPVPPEQQTPRQVPLSPRPGPEPLSYVTQQRFGGEFRVQRPERFDDPELPPTQQLPAQDRPTYRPRDYSPEGRSAVPSWAPTYTQTPNPYAAREGSGLEYHTQARPDAFAARDESAAESTAVEPTTHGAHAAPEAGAEPVSEPPTTTGVLGLGGERTITRRELRALREAEEARAAAAAGAPAAAAAAAPDIASPFAPSSFAPPAAPDASLAPVEAPEAPVEAAEAPVEDETRPADAVESPAESPAPAEPIARPWSPVDELTVPRDEPDSTPPVALVEPPEPARWTPQTPGGQTPGAPSVFEALFTPPSRRDAESETPDAAPVDSAVDAPVDEAVAEPPAATVHDLADAPAPDPVAATEPATEPDAAAVTADPEPETTPDAQQSPFVATPPAQPAWAGFDDRPAPISLDDLLAGRAKEAAAAPAAEVTAPPTAPPAETPAPADPFAAAAPVPPAPEPSAWQRSDGEIVDAEVIADIPAPQPVAEPKPVVIDATPLPAEPIERSEPPVGHWTTQEQIDDDAIDFVGSRDVHGGHGVITTNALVLPAIPQPEFNNPLAATGEILITGSIELPRSLSATGAHEDLLEEFSLDHELDPGDHQVVSTESAPVRAVRAVSTHTNSGSVIAGLKPRSNRSLTVLIIATAVMAAAAAVLVVVMLTTGAL